MTLNHETQIKLVYQDGETAYTTWGEFATVNADDPDELDAIKDQWEALGYAEGGGGAAPWFRIKAAS